MKCPSCNFKSTRVQDSRPYKNNTSVKRRRCCPNCSYKFVTEEIIFSEVPAVVKKDGRREPFSLEKIRKGLQAACQKRPISQSQIEALVNKVKSKVSQKGGNEINSEIIGKFLMAELKKMDEVAYIRFASVYMTFKEVNEFFENLGDLR